MVRRATVSSVRSVRPSHGDFPEAHAAVERALPVAALERCYAVGLARNGELHGTTRMRLVVDRFGAVWEATNAGHDLRDFEVAHCSFRSFATIHFEPAPAGAIAWLVELAFESGRSATRAP